MDNTIATYAASHVDPEVLGCINERNAEIANGGRANSKLTAALALGSIPIALGALANDVFAQTPSDVMDVLQFALLLEHLEAEFYTRGTQSGGPIPSSESVVFATIRDHENAHVAALTQVIQAKGGTPGAKPAFDFTAKGAVPNPFAPGNYQIFLALSQAFEDTGVRAYKGQAGRLIGDKQVLSAALAIHSVEARHASMVRYLRGQKGWITLDDRGGLPAFAQPIYNGEQNVTQAGVNLSALGNGNGGIDAVTQAFDEPLTKEQVTAIVTPFLA